MAYDANGKWVEENTSVAKGVSGLIAQDSPLMQVAKTTATKAASGRGLINSSIAVGAAQGEVIKAATPIATADANNANALNQTQMNNRSQEGVADKQMQTQRDLNAANLGSQEKISANQLQTSRDLNANELGSRATLQTEQLGASAMQQQKALDSQALLQTQNLGVQTQIAGMNIAANDRQRAAEAVSQIEVTYANQFATISNNEKIPAATRQAYLENIQAIRQSNYGLIEQIYGVKLTWGQPGGPAAVAGSNATYTVPPAKGEPAVAGNYPTPKAATATSQPAAVTPAAASVAPAAVPANRAAALAAQKAKLAAARGY